MESRVNGEKSWVKDIARNDADLLKHEQVHFKNSGKGGREGGKPN